MDNEPILDREFLNKVTNNDLHMQNMLLNKYIRITKGLIDDIDPTNYDEVMDSAHSIKGSSYQLGLIKMGNVSRDLEFVIKNEDYGRVDELIEYLKDVFDTTCLFIYSS